MGKGDQRSRRGKIYRGSFGKSRPKDPAKRQKKAKRAAAQR
jgi:30S ribosomal protein S31